MYGKRFVTLRQEQFQIENGRVWQVAYDITVPGSTTHYLGMTTGQYEVEIDDRLFSTQGSDTRFTLYTNTEYTGGSEIPMWNRRHRFQSDATRNPLTDIKGGVTASPSAANLRGSVYLTTAGASERVYGDQSSANIILSANTSYVVGIQNNDANAGTATFAAILIQRAQLADAWRPML